MTKRSWLKPLNAFGVVIVFASCWLAGRLAWEQTVWTWERGPQMVGFSLMHSGIGILLFLALLVGGPIWILSVAFSWWRNRSFGTMVTWVLLIAYACSWGVLSIPKWAWERVFIDRMVRSSNAADLLFYAAGRGDLETVKAYLDRGLSVNARTCSQAFTPIHGAARGGNVELIKYLISQGADVNATNVYGDSPLCDAEERNLTAAINILEMHGAKRIVGTAEQRDAGVTEYVSRSSESATECADPRQGEIVEAFCDSTRWNIK
jgi:hypothetical protein